MTHSHETDRHCSDPMKSTAAPDSVPDAPPAISAAATDALMRQQLTAVASGNRGAFQSLYLSLHPALDRFLSRHTRRRELIDEIINETFWVVWRKASGFRGESRVSSWIIGIAYRCMLVALREAGGATVADCVDVDQRIETSDDDQNDHGRELRDWVRGGLALLPAEQRITLELAYYLGLSCEEIAGVMDCAIGTVKARLFHARVRLRNSLPLLAGDIATATMPRSATP